jgi:hypothetical protein
MTGPALYGDPIDPNPPMTEVPQLYAPPTMGYAPVDWNTVVHPGSPYGGWTAPRPPDERPGEAVAAAVLSLVVAALLLITGFVVIFAASSLENEPDTDPSQRTTLFVFAGLVNVIAAAILIVGGVLLLSRSKSARATIASGALLCLALGVFWLANDQGDNGVVVWLIIFCLPVIVATLLTASTRITAWIRSAPPLR